LVIVLEHNSILWGKWCIVVSSVAVKLSVNVCCGCKWTTEKCYTVL